MIKFHNVGNALFAVEWIEGHYIVYDCGGQNITSLENAIQNTFRKGDIIEAVFISHYDSDHINGLHYLLNYCRVKRLILPMMPDGVRFMLLILQTYTVELETFVRNPEEFIQRVSPETQVIFVDDSEEEGPIDFNRSISFEQLTQSNVSHIASSTKLYFMHIHWWVFVPMCIRTLSAKEIDDFINRLYSILGVARPKGRIDMKKLWEDYTLCDRPGGKGIKNKIKKAICDTVSKMDKKGINAASQTLYSGPDIQPDPMLSGCLYLGDYDASKNWAQLCYVYGKYRQNIKVIQVPHHGCIDYFNENLINKGTFAVVSIGTDNKIKLGDTITKIAKRGGMPLMTGYLGKDLYIKCDVTGNLYFW